MIGNFNIKLTSGQLKRLMLILDEDMSGEISLDEYQNALQAYKVAEEKHVNTSGTDVNLSFEHRAIFKLIEILQTRDMTYEELYRACDVNNDNNVNLHELEKMLESLSLEFFAKEIQAIRNFFDINGDNIVTEQEFMGQLLKGERLHQAHQQRLSGRPTTAGELRGKKSLDGLNAYIDNFDQYSPRTQGEKLSEFLQSELR